MEELSIPQLVKRFENVYGDILKDKKQWVTVYNAYCDKMNYRTKVLSHKEKYYHQGRIMYNHVYKYEYVKWGRWSWEAYEYYQRIPNHTRTQFGEGITQKYIKAVGLLPKNVINRIVTHEV